MNAHAKFISEARVEKALTFLVESAADIGRAKESAENAKNNVKHKEALLLKLSEAKTDALRAADVRTSQDWLDATAEEASAAGEMAALYARREAESAIIEAWRSQEATLRAVKI